MLKKYFSLFLLLFTISIILSIVIWAINKGFDLSDEGYYIAGYSNLVERPFGLSAFHFFTTHTLSKLGSGLIFFRVIRLIFIIFGSLFLSLGLFSLLTKYNIIKKENKQRMLITLSLFCLIGGFTSYGFGPQTLSYNHYTLFLGNIFLGLLFFELTYSQNKKRTMFISAVCGIICGFEFFIKIPTSIILSLLFLCVQILLYKKLGTSSFINILLYAFSCILAFTLISFPFSPIFILNEYYHVISYASKDTSHGVFDVIMNYKNGIYDLWYSHLINFVPLLLCLLSALLISQQKRYKTIKAAGRYFFLFILLFMIYKLYDMSYFMAGLKFRATISFVSFLFIFIASIILISLYINRNFQLLSIFSLDKMFVVLTLFLFPFICSFGTSNYLQVQITLFLNTWFLLIYLIYTVTKIKKSKYSFAVYIMILTLIVKSTNDVWAGLVIDPYRVKGPLWEQTEALKIPSANETIFIDKELMKTIMKLQQSITEHKPDAFFVSSDVNGLCYVFNKKLIAYGWTDCSSVSKEFICESYNESALKEKNKIYFILNSSANSCNIFDCLFDNKIQSKLLAVPWNNNSNDSLFVYERRNE